MTVLSPSPLEHQRATADAFRHQAQQLRAMARRMRDARIAAMLAATSRECDEQAARIEIQIVIGRPIH